MDKKRNDMILDDFFLEHKVKGVIVFNSTCHIVARYFEENNIDDTVLVGYDGVEKNIAMMKKGFVDVLIAQRPYYQGYETTKSLCNFLLRKTMPNAKNYIPLDILVRENVDFYNFQ
ncbi:MAG: substrate-binding domain-containing protein [Paludibacteraceae bacterium]